jgi:cyclopropane fatty-acyl-phospholipid synthase-like methyltransferase
MASQASFRDLLARMNPNTTSQAFFENMYRRNSDPWNFASNPYELSRYAAILRRIGHKSYKHVFEPGCSIGVLTAQLASVAERLDAVDISPTVVLGAKKRCQSFSNVHIVCGALPHQVPEGAFDLVVFSEIGYYFAEAALHDIIRRIVARMCEGGTFLAAHWLGSSPDHLLSGDQVHEVIDMSDELKHRKAELHEGFRLDLWERL